MTGGEAQEVFKEWATWLVKGAGAPWDWRPGTLPPQSVLDEMPAVMFQYDNVRGDGSIVNEDVKVEDYAQELGEEWGITG